MSTPESRKEIYRRCRLTTDINKRQWAKLLNLGVMSGATEVGKKENPDKPTPSNTSKGVSMADALAAGLLEYLYLKGFDVENTEFDDDGTILDIPIG